MTVPGVLDDQALRRYRELLDAEDAAFDELEHAYEEGDRAHFEADLSAWRQSLARKLAFLQRMGIDIPQPAVSPPSEPSPRSTPRVAGVPTRPSDGAQPSRSRTAARSDSSSSVVTRMRSLGEVAVLEALHHVPRRAVGPDREPEDEPLGRAVLAV